MPRFGLTAHPRFGDSRQLKTDLSARLLSLLADSRLPTDLPARHHDADLIDRFLGDPVVRSLQPGSVEVAELWALAQRAAATGALTAVANEYGNPEPLRLAEHAAWLFRTGPGPLNRRLQDVIGGYASTIPGPARLCDGRDEDRQALAEAADVLVEVVPDLAADALGWVRVVACLDTGLVVHSATIDCLPGVVLVDRAALVDRLVGAELLLHEALHAKFDALLTTRQLTAVGHQAGRIVAVWHPAGNGGRANQWPIVRAISAFHVYAHLVVFGAALAEAPASAGYGAELRERALFRAWYLGAELLRSARYLGGDGVALVRWLVDLLPAPGTLPVEQQCLIGHGLHGQDEAGVR